MECAIYTSITYLSLICLCFWFFKYNVIEHDWSNWHFVCTAFDIYLFSILANEIITGKVPNYESLEIISPFIIMNKVMKGYCHQFTSNVPGKMQKLIEKHFSYSR